jgi:hypothetical protein
MLVKVNGIETSTINVSGVSRPTLANGSSYAGNLNVSSPEIKIGLDFDNLGNPSTIGYLDFISIEARRQLNYNGKQFLFKNSDVALASGIAQYNITNTSQLSEIWDVTDLYNVTNYINTESASTLSFTSTLGSLKSYVAVSPQITFHLNLIQKL